MFDSDLNVNLLSPVPCGTMSTFNLSFNPSAFAKAAKQHKLFIRSASDTDRVRIPNQLLQIKRLAGAYSIHLFSKSINPKHDRIMGNIMWNDLIDHNTRTLCGDIGSQEVPLFSHIKSTLVGIAALDRPFLEFYRRMCDLPWSDEGGHTPSKTLTSATIGSFRRDVIDMFDLYKSLSVSLYSRLSDYIYSVCEQSVGTRLQAKVDDGALTTETATKRRAEVLASFDSPHVASSGVPMAERIESLRDLLNNDEAASNEEVAALLSTFEHDAKSVPRPGGLVVSNLKDRVTSMQTEDARVRGVFMGCLDRHHIRPHTLPAGDPVLVESWKCHITLECAPSWVRHQLRKLGSRIAKEGTFEEVMLVISQMCLEREYAQASRAPSLPPRHSVSSRPAPSSKRNGRNRHSDRFASTPSKVKMEQKYPRDNSRHGTDSSRPPKPQSDSVWDRELNKWRPSIPDQDWELYKAMSKPDKHDYLKSIRSAPRTPKPSQSTPSAKPHVPYQTPYSNRSSRSAPSSAGRAPTKTEPRRPRRPRHGQFQGNYNDTSRKGRRSGSFTRSSRSDQKRSSSGHVFTPGDHQVLTDLVDDYVTDDEISDDSGQGVAFVHVNTFAALSDTSPPSASKNGGGEG